MIFHNHSALVSLATAITVASSMTIIAEEAPLNPTGSEDLAPREQPVLNYEAAEVTTAKWDNPRNRHYTYSNFEKVHPYPSIISRGTGPFHTLPVVPEGWRHVEGFRIKPWREAEDMNLSRYLYESRADALVILKDGKIIYEAYPRQLQPHQTHSMMSSSKVIAALVIANLIDEGKLQLDTLIKDIIPELGTAFDGVTVHQALNMNVVMNFSEDYTDPNSEGQRIFVAECWGEGCENDPRGVRGFLTELTSDDPSNNPENNTLYNSAVTSVLGWVIERKTGMNYNNAVSFYLFKHIGASANGIGLNDQTGFGHASGYLAFTPRDAAMLYSTIGNDGVAPNGARILPKGYIDTHVYGDDAATKYFAGTTSQWWYTHQMYYNDKGGMAHLGYGGQMFYSNKDSGITIIQMGSIDSEGGAVTFNLGNGLLDAADLLNELLKDLKP
ncbi:serine hydrolase domain-containing protein [Ruegeria sp. SCP11]|uniref:serine hydrolase domain-containing protein n=1 Tax=Ruegeria sp. SCP11 TaxID=3141378 RepID=UPI003336D73E